MTLKVETEGQSLVWGSRRQSAKAPRAHRSPAVDSASDHACSVNHQPAPLLRAGVMVVLFMLTYSAGSACSAVAIIALLGRRLLWTYSALGSSLWALLGRRFLARCRILRSDHRSARPSYSRVGCGTYLRLDHRLPSGVTATRHRTAFDLKAAVVVMTPAAQLGLHLARPRSDVASGSWQDAPASWASRRGSAAERAARVVGIADAATLDGAPARAARRPRGRLRGRRRRRRHRRRRADAHKPAESLDTRLDSTFDATTMPETHAARSPSRTARLCQLLCLVRLLYHRRTCQDQAGWKATATRS